MCSFRAGAHPLASRNNSGTEVEKGACKGSCAGPTGTAVQLSGRPRVQTSSACSAPTAPTHTARHHDTNQNGCKQCIGHSMSSCSDRAEDMAYTIPPEQLQRFPLAIADRFAEQQPADC